MNPRVPERKVGSPCQLETETASSLAQAKEEEDDDGNDDEEEKVETKPRSTTLLARTPASLFSTPGATETVMCAAVISHFGVGSKEKTSEATISVSSITTACALPSSATPVARSRGPVEPRRGAKFAIVCASGLNASVRWSAETFAWEGGALRVLEERERKSFFFIQEVENKQNKKKLATGTRPLSLTHFSFLSTHRQRSSSRESTSRKMAAYLTASLGGRRKAGSFLRVSWRRAAASEEEEEEAVHAGGDGGGVSSDACCFILRETRSFPAAETTAPLLPSLPRREKKPAGCCKNERSRNQRPRRGRLIERESRRPP
jgi:hypothetical protein